MYIGSHIETIKENNIILSVLIAYKKHVYILFNWYRTIR